MIARRRPGRALAVLVVCGLVVGLGCKRQEAFVCKHNRQCTFEGIAGTCQPGGFCSFPDEQCPGGLRYGGHAPEDVRGKCVEAKRCGDGALDAPEACDDGNADNDDGCTRGCVVCNEAIGSLRFAGEGGRCYARFDEPLPWEKAAETCAAIDGHLVAFQLEAEQIAVERELLRGDRARFWIGNQVGPDGATAEWVTGEPLPAGFWHPDSAANAETQGTCTSMSAGAIPGRSLAYLWSREDCSNTRPFVCEIPPWYRRPGGGSAYRMIPRRLTWQDARDACARTGGRLALVENESVRDFITSRFSGQYWIGATDLEREGTFVWVDGTPAKYKDFADGEPDNLGGRANCVAVDRDRLWHDRHCSYKYRPVCEHP